MIEKERTRREYDALRTGSVSQQTPSRTVSQYTQSGQVNAADRLREIQAKRRESLEQARRHANAGVDIAIGVATTGPPPIKRPISAARAASGARSASSARPASSGPQPARRVPRQPAPGPLIGGRAPLPSRQGTRAPSPQQRSRPTSRAVLKAAPPLEPLLTRAVKRKRAQHAELGSHSEVHRLIADVEPTSRVGHSRTAISAGQLARMSPLAWRTAIVMREVLSPPIALRQ